MIKLGNLLKEIEIGIPNQFIKLNLPKDLDREVNTIDYDNIEDSVKKLIVLNPQIPSNIIYQEEAIDDVSPESDYPISSLEDILKLYFRFLPRYLFYYYNGYNQEETTEQYNEMDRFAKEAMNGKWEMIPKITDFKNDKPYDEDLNEIEVGIPDNSLSRETLNIIKDKVISYVKEIIQGDGYTPAYSFLDYLLDKVDVPGGDSNYNIVTSFIIEQMIANNYELYYNGEEILLTNSNSNLVTREDIENYLEENTTLKKYLEKLTWGYYFNEININSLYHKCIRYVKDRIEPWGEGEFDKRDFEKMVERELDNQDYLQPDDVLTYNPEFQDYLQSKFLRADKLNEMKLNKLKILKEEEKAYHGSPNYFTSFKKEGIGGGSGSQMFGWGLYFGTNVQTAKGYVQAGGNSGKTKTLFQGKTPEDLGLEYENEIFFGLPSGLKTSQDYIEYAEENILLLEEEPDFEGKEDLIKDYKRFIEIIKDLEVEHEPSSYLYKVTLFPGKTPDYLDWDLRKTPQNQIDKINKEAQKEGWEEFEVNSDMSPGEVYEYINQYILNNKKNKYSLGTDRQITYAAGHDTSMFLVRAGIDGNTHSRGEVRIVFDDRQIKIDKIYKVKDFDTIDESKKSLLREYSEKIIQQMIEKFQKEMRNTLSVDDIKLKINRFEQIKSNLPKKIEAGLKGEAGGMVVPKKFTEPDPKTQKILNSQDILNYTWKDLETIIDAYGTKGEKTTKDFNTVQDADFVDVQGVPVTYSGNGLKVYEGSSYEGCVKLNYVFKYKGKDDKIYSYGFCIGRKEDSANQYYTYRFGRGGAFRSFYYVADTTQNADIEGDPNNRENFLNWYHFFVIHVFDDGGYGVTDACNVWGSNHEATGGDKGISWEQVGAFMVKHGGESGKKAWDKIRNIKDVFKYIEPSSKETDEALVRDKILNFEQFKNLNRNQQKIYISRRADQSNAFNSEMFNLLPVDLKNLALRTGNGFKPTYNDIKDSNALSRSYARFRFTRALDDIKTKKFTSNVLPLPFVPFLTDEEKEEYYNEFGKGGTNGTSYLTYELIEKYFGPKITQQYVEKQANKLGFLPPAATKYIKDPKLKALFEVYSKLFEPWVFTSSTNLSDEQLANLNAQPRQRVDAKPISVKQWGKLTPEERKIIIQLTQKYNENTDYLELIYGLPYIIKDKGKNLIFLPESNEGDIFEKWVLVDENDKVVKRNISGYSLLDDQDISRGIIGSVGQYGKRIYDISELEMEDADSLNEIEVGISNKAYRLKLPNIETVDIDNDDEVINIIETIAKLNPTIPKQYFEAGSVFDDVMDWVGNKIKGPVIPFKVFLESYFYWLGRNLIYDLNPDNENIYDIDYDDNEVKRFAKEATNGTWVMIPGISDFKNLNYITEIEVGIPNQEWSSDELYKALIKKGMDLNQALIGYENEYILMNIDTPEKYSKEEILEYLRSLRFKPTSILEQTIPSVHGGDYYSWMVRCENPNPKKPKINDGNDLWELMKPEFEKTILGNLDEIEVGLPKSAKEQLLDMGEYEDVINGNTYKVLEFDPWGGGWGGMHPPTKNHVWLQKKGTRASDMFRGKYVNYKEILNRVKKNLKEIEVGIPALPFKQLVKSYTEYLNGITRTEMFDENGMYNSKLNDYHNQLKYYAQNGDEDEQQVANFALSFIY